MRCERLEMFAPSCAEDSGNLAHTAPSDKSGKDPTLRPPAVARRAAKICTFTRHKHELAKAVTLGLRAASQRLLEVLLTVADADGVSCIGIATIVDLMPRSPRRPRYHRRTVELAADDLAAMGYLSWTRVHPCSYYPPTSGGRRRGRWTQSGGRVWRVDLAAVRRANRPDRRAERPSAQNLCGYDLQIGGTYDLQIASSDPLPSLREGLRITADAPPDAPPFDAPPTAPAAPADVASETSRELAASEPPEVSHPAQAAQERIDPPDPPAPPPPRPADAVAPPPRAASKPSPAARASAAPRAPRPATAPTLTLVRPGRERQQGNGPVSPERSPEPVQRVGAADIARLMDRLRTGALTTPGRRGVP